MRITPLIVLVVALPLTAADNSEVNDLISRLPNSPPETHKPIVQKLAAGDEAALNPIIDALKEPGTGDDRNARYALHALAVHAGAPGNDNYRSVFARRLRDSIKRNAPTQVNAFLIQQLAVAGEPLSAVTLLLDEQLGTHVALGIAGARRKNEKYVSDLGSALGVAGPMEPHPAHSGDVIWAAARLGSGGFLDHFLSDKKEALRITARRALAFVGEPDSAKSLLQSFDGSSPFERAQAIDAALLLARRLTESDHGPEAEKIYRHLLTTHPDTPHVQAAALQGLAQVAPNEQTLVILLDTLTRGPKGSASSQDHLALQIIALQTAATLPGRAITRALLKQVDAAPPELAARILESLATRGDPDALEGILALTKHADASVRHGAMTAAAVLGGERAIPTLITLLRNESDRQAAQQALSKAPGQRATTAIADAIPDAQPSAAKASLLDVLAARSATAHLDVITAALKDESDQVRAAAVTALGALGQPAQTADLLTFLSTAKTDTDRSAAETSILTLTRLTPDQSTRAAPLLAALPKTTDLANRATLLRILGRLGALAALDPLRAALADQNEQIRDAAVRALAAWPTPDDPALAELLNLAKSARNNTHRVLALRAYVRLAAHDRLPADRKLDMYRQSLALAKTADDKKLALAGVGDLRDPRALPLLTPLLDDQDTQQEAAAAILRVTRDMRGNADELKPIFQKIAAIARDERVKREANNRLQTLGAK